MFDKFKSWFLNKERQKMKLHQHPDAEGEFGLSPTNPLLVEGIPEIYKFLSLLRLPSGEKVTWQRQKGAIAENLRVPGAGNMPVVVECFTINTQSGGYVADIYFYPFHTFTFFVPPKGLTIEKDLIV